MKKNKWLKLGTALLFVIGLAIALYPAVSQYINYLGSLTLVQDFQQTAGQLPKEEVDRRLELAYYYNETLDPRRLLDPFTKEQKEGVAEYARMLEVNERIGVIDIPKLDLKLPIYAGTSEKVLQEAVGHLEGTSLPVGGTSTHTVVTAHRGLPSHRLFTDLDKLKEGDVFYFRNIGETLAYRVENVKVVDPTALEEVLVVPDRDLATLLTCTPYMVNSHRLLVTGHRIDYVDPEREAALIENLPVNLYKHAFFVVLGLLVLVVVILIVLRRRKKVKGDA